MYPILEVHAEAHKRSPDSTSAQIEVKVDRSAQSLAVDLPEGLLETYLGQDATEGEWWDGDESQ